MSGRLGAIVASALAAVLVLCVCGFIGLALAEVPVPSVLENLASGALGALAALLARVGDRDEVVVSNRRDEPVPVSPAPAAGPVQTDL